ncbi:MAG: cytochrome c family protein [Planctomycetota bacterium]|nr:cytochrome c family protein [Planctomycetota bacterium]
MVQKAKKHWRSLAVILAVVGMVGWVASGLAGFDGQNVLADPQGIKYTGAGSCAAAACHGSQTPKEDGSTRHDENTIWSNKDAHAKAHGSLLSDDSKAWAKNLKIEDASKSERCLNCHALSGFTIHDNTVHRVVLKPEDINAEKYSVEDGVSCDACHGPADKYLKDHTTKGWTQKQRDTLGSQKTFDEWGLYDTKNVMFRANVCLSCHLKIDGDLVAAGHPELPFELSIMSSDEEWIHWRNHGAWTGFKIWAMGQVVSLRESAVQTADRTKAGADEKLVKGSYDRMLGHAILTRQTASAVDAEGLAALDKLLGAVKADWADAGKREAALRALAKGVDEWAAKLNGIDFDQAKAEAVLKGVAAEGEQVAPLGYRAGETFVMSAIALVGAHNKDGKPADADAKMEKAGGLYDALGDKDTYDAAKFGPGAKAMAEWYPGGKSLPLP